jgi:GNAT superfamily N-acetyltransferase
VQVFLEKLDGEHDRKRFQSGQPALDFYLQHQAHQDIKRNLSSVFVLATAKKEIIGFYAISQSSLIVEELPEQIAKKLPPKRSVPCTLLGRLAVDERYQGKGYGRDLLFYALKKSAEINEHIASFAVIVDAKDENAKRFYQKYGFIEFVKLPMRLFIPMKAVGQVTNLGSGSNTLMSFHESTDIKD